MICKSVSDSDTTMTLTAWLMHVFCINVCLCIKMHLFYNYDRTVQKLMQKSNWLTFAGQHLPQFLLFCMDKTISYYMQFYIKQALTVLFFPKQQFQAICCDDSHKRLLGKQTVAVYLVLSYAMVPSISAIIIDWHLGIRNVHTTSENKCTRHLQYMSVVLT